MVHTTHCLENEPLQTKAKISLHPQPTAMGPIAPSPLRPRPHLQLAAQAGKGKLLQRAQRWRRRAARGLRACEGARTDGTPRRTQTRRLFSGRRAGDGHRGREPTWGQRWPAPPPAPHPAPPPAVSRACACRLRLCPPTCACLAARCLSSSASASARMRASHTTCAGAWEGPRARPPENGLGMGPDERAERGHGAHHTSVCVRVCNCVHACVHADVCVHACVQMSVCMRASTIKRLLPTGHEASGAGATRSATPGRACVRAHACETAASPGPH